MATLKEGNYTSDVLAWEEDNFYSREQVVVASGNSLKVGAVLGMVTASSEVVLHDPAAGDSSEVVHGVLIADDVDATNAAAPGIAVVRQAQVKRAGLNFHSSIDTEGEPDTVCAALKALGIVCL